MGDEGWQPGDLVRVLAGPFAEYSGTVAEVDAAEAKLRVRLAVMGSAYLVELGFDDVEPYDPDNAVGGSARWRRGSAVRVLAGPYQYLPGVVQTADDATERVVVRLTGLRPEVSIEFHYNDIESA